MNIQTFVSQWLDPENQMNEEVLRDLARCCICGKPAISMCAECCRDAGISNPSIKVGPDKLVDERLAGEKSR